LPESDLLQATKVTERTANKAPNTYMLFFISIFFL
jgi:hypothetical protein